MRPRTQAARLFCILAKYVQSRRFPEPKGNPTDTPSQEVATILAKADDEHLVFGVILEPDKPDVHRDQITAAEIAKAAHHYMIEGHDVRVQHGTESVVGQAHVVESFIAPVDFEMGGQTIKAGSWVMGAHVPDPALWARIKSGELTGFSPKGPAWRSIASG